VQWWQSTPIWNGNSLPISTLKKEFFFGKGVGCELFYHGLTQSGFAYEGVDWIANWIFSK
jgi:hypothetical protein